jgi:hypothetical protein
MVVAAAAAEGRRNAEADVKGESRRRKGEDDDEVDVRS